jgi:hypothetical protein
MGVRDATTGELSAAELFSAVHLLRTGMLDLLSEASSHSDSSGALAPAMARLQSAANELGAVERLLKPDPAPNGPPPSGDAAAVLALAATTVPLSSSPVDEAERWVRVLRAHGRVGAALHSLGVPAHQLPTMADSPEAGGSARPDRPVEAVSELALEFARLHGSRTLDTVHVLFAVLAVHGARFDRALYAHGTTRQQLLDCLVTGVSLPS